MDRLSIYIMTPKLTSVIHSNPPSQNAYYCLVSDPQKEMQLNPRTTRQVKRSLPATQTT